MTKRFLQFATIFFTLSFSTASIAQLDLKDWYVAPSVVFTDDDADRRIDDSLAGLQINVGRTLWDFAALEMSLGYSEIDGYYRFNSANPYFRDTQTHLDISANILGFYDREAVFAPYVIAGVGYLGVSQNSGGDENRPSFTLGLGAKYQLGDSNFALRAEYRARAAYEEDRTLTDRIATVGFQYNFGASKRNSELDDPTNDNQNIDTDGDGVLDIWG